ncbi:GIY-YIG nuclease family protein [Paenibacillus sp. USHLN196]|uniref:GIY-YIG nuclease family protein n=1 Tax=Paenibacillus sp. USHLN196 TaxID=3081291 RepID=UPI003FA78070
MAPVSIISIYQCYNMNPQKLEQLLHSFFGNCCLNIDVYDKKGVRHTPREWFIAPLSIIEESIELIINRDIVNYKYDINKEQIINR